MTEKRIAADWEAIERDYRAGILSLGEIGKKHGVTKGRISQVAKAKEWTRDLSTKIKAKAKDKLNASALNDALNAPSDRLDRLADAEVVEAGANLLVAATLAHRADIKRGRQVGMRLFAELDQACADPAALEALAELVASPEADESGRLRAAFDRAMSLGGRVKTFKDLAEATRTVIQLERQALGMDGDKGGDGSFEDRVADL